MELLEKETVIFNNEVVTLCDYIVSTNDSDEKSLVTATPLLADYMTAETACEVIQRYFEFNTVHYTRIMAFVHSYSDLKYLKKFKDIELADQIQIDGIVEKITFLGHMNSGGDITKTFINIYCTEVQ